MQPAPVPRPSAWEPFHHPLFRFLWIASFASNIGTWMQNVGASWLMTSIAPSPVYVALVQTATSLPIFLLGLPAGALADIVDRRIILLVTQAWMLAAAALLSLLTLSGWISPSSLLALTFLLGLGAAMNGPAWQAIVPELVPRQQLPAAIALNSVSFNMARAIGPALSGLILSFSNAGVAFLLNALSFVGVLWVIFRWQRTPVKSIAATERLFGAIRTGVRYLRYASALQCVLVRVAVFILGASSIWALLPLVARTELHQDSGGYGLLLGGMGAGSVAGALLLPRFRTRLSTERQVVWASVAFLLALLLVAAADNFYVVCTCMLIAGAAWMTVMSNFNIAVQTIVPEWVRARALGVYLVVFQGIFALGGLLWGTLAERFGVRAAIALGAVAIAAGLLAALRFPMSDSSDADLSPAARHSEPHITLDLQPGDGPVMVMVEYQIDVGQVPAFERAMRDVGRQRRRDGAVRWMLFHDPLTPGRCAEFFLVESWAEHLRQFERKTVADRIRQQQALVFHTAGLPPRVTHWIATSDRV